MSEMSRLHALIASLPPLGFKSGVATELEIKLTRLCDELERELAAALKTEELTKPQVFTMTTKTYRYDNGIEDKLVKDRVTEYVLKTDYNALEKQLAAALKREGLWKELLHELTEKGKG